MTVHDCKRSFWRLELRLQKYQQKGSEVDSAHLWLRYDFIRSETLLLSATIQGLEAMTATSMQVLKNVAAMIPLYRLGGMHRS